jgi:hypothetical protein
VADIGLGGIEREGSDLFPAGVGCFYGWTSGDDQLLVFDD